VALVPYVQRTREQEDCILHRQSLAVHLRNTGRMANLSLRAMSCLVLPDPPERWCSCPRTGTFYRFEPPTTSRQPAVTFSLTQSPRSAEVYGVHYPLPHTGDIDCLAHPLPLPDCHALTVRLCIPPSVCGTDTEPKAIGCSCSHGYLS
jgi:hypothetical protein